MALTIEATAQALADFRRSVARDLDDPQAKRRTCPGCGVVYVQPRGDWKRDCPDCAAKRLVDSAEQMRTKSGPMYEKAVRRNYAYWRAEAERLGLLRDERPLP